ncbi:hypothetical protein CC78DRAFT_612013 [Lojkania enalia]|uniref:NADAR domain-containing protein n=1 Tax=Lojkania enalia TaxID=147567 RepID=A0A9P4NAK8_9PLEO|nr:hypothetical protein CC78DRAFT_612013 [Didymosphaeria enalia]
MEHYIMYRKAVLFNDPSHAEKILIAATPAEARALRRQVRGFNRDKWKNEVAEVTDDGTWLNFNVLRRFGGRGIGISRFSAGRTWSNDNTVRNLSPAFYIRLNKEQNDSDSNKRNMGLNQAQEDDGAGHHSSVGVSDEELVADFGKSIQLYVPERKHWPLNIIRQVFIGQLYIHGDGVRVDDIHGLRCP